MKNNDLIAEFMGLKKSNELCEKSFTYVGTDIIKAGLPFINGIMGNCKDELPFDTSWDWLMPVVRKCEDVRLNSSIQSNEYDRLIGNITNRLIQVDLLAVHSNIVDFIETYNSK